MVDSATKIVALGGDYRKARLSFQEYFGHLGTDPKRWSKPFGALLGALTAQAELKIPAIGGKDSMSGTFMDIDVPPTLISFAVAAADANDVVSSRNGSGETVRWYTYTREQTNPGVIDFEQYRRNMERVMELTAQKKILSMNPVGPGGIFVTLCEMAAGNKIGAVITGKYGRALHSAETGALILEISREYDAEELLKGISFEILGETTDAQEIVIADTGEKITLDEMIEAWCEPLESRIPYSCEGGRQTGGGIPVCRAQCSASGCENRASRRFSFRYFREQTARWTARGAFVRAGGDVEMQIIGESDASAS